MEFFYGKPKLQEGIGARHLHFEKSSDDYSNKVTKNLQNRSLLPLFLYFFSSGILHCFITILCWKRTRRWKWLPWLLLFPYWKMDPVWPKFKQVVSLLGNKLPDTLNNPNLCGWSPRKERGGWKLHPRTETQAGTEGRHTPRTEFTSPTFRWVSCELLTAGPLWGGRKMAGLTLWGSIKLSLRLKYC